MTQATIKKNLAAPTGRTGHGDWPAVASLLAIAVLLMVLIRTAWIGDDAYITLRTVDNLIHGYGPTFNIDERVQAFTHPLWMLLLSAVYFVTREAYYTTIVVSIVLTLATAIVCIRYVGATWLAGVLAVLCLAVSKPFVDYSTSGLANPLIHLLLATLFYLVYRGRSNPRSALLVYLTVALLACTRLDTLALTTPVLMLTMWQHRRDNLFRSLLIGFSPLVLWLLFATFYYGSPIPNTAFAKLSTGISANELWHQGWIYLKNGAVRSPVTAIVMSAGVAYALASRDKRLIALVVGIAFYLTYVAKVGGDFMQGRFLTAAFLTSVLILSTYRFEWSNKPALSAALIVLGLSFFSPTSPVYSGADYGLGLEKRDWDAGISDERAAYFQQTGLFVSSDRNRVPTHGWIDDGLQARDDTAKVVYCGGMGFFGYYAGPQVHLVGGHALADPLRSHLPTRTLHHWRIGHFFRKMPDGYYESLVKDTNLIVNPSLRSYYQPIREITRGPLFNADRLFTIVKWNLGQYNQLRDDFVNRTVTLRASAVSNPLPQGLSFSSNACHIIGKNGLCIEFDSLVHYDRLEWSVNHNDGYLLLYRTDDTILDSTIVGPKWITGGGLRVDTLEVPSNVTEQGYDNLLVMPHGRHWSQSLGHLRGID